MKCVWWYIAGHLCDVCDVTVYKHSEETDHHPFVAILCIFPANLWKGKGKGFEIAMKEDRSIICSPLYLFCDFFATGFVSAMEEERIILVLMTSVSFFLSFSSSRSCTDSSWLFESLHQHGSLQQRESLQERESLQQHEILKQHKSICNILSAFIKTSIPSHPPSRSPFDQTSNSSVMYHS